MRVDVVYAYTIKGRGVVKTLEGERLWAVGKTLDRQEADYIAQGFRFANLARTNPNKEAVPQSVPLRIFKRQWQFYEHANKALLGRSASHTSGCAHAENSLTRASGLVFMDAWINTPPSQVYI